MHSCEAESSFNKTVELLLAGDGTLIVLGEEANLKGLFGFGQVELSLFWGAVLGVTIGQQTHPTDVLEGDERGVKELKTWTSVRDKKRVDKIRFLPLHNW